MGGAPGAAFIAAALIQLQDAPVEVANLFHGEAGAFGLFNENGVPLKNFQAVKAFQQMFKTPRRVVTELRNDSLSVVAGLNEAGTEAAVLLANVGSTAIDLNIKGENLPWREATLTEVRMLDGSHDFEPKKSIAASRAGVVVPVVAPGHSVLLIRLRAAP
jgi:hypothetical protein